MSYPPLQLPNRPGFRAYMIEVVSYLSYLGYDEYAEMFDPADIAVRVLGSCVEIFNENLSHRAAALIIFGMTLEHRVKPMLERGIKH